MEYHYNQQVIAAKKVSVDLTNIHIIGGKKKNLSLF